MRISLLLLSFILLFTHCNQDTWRVEMTSRLDSMVTLSSNHETVVEGIDSNVVYDAYMKMGAFQIFFNENLEEMEKLGISKKMYTGPLFQMDNCVKYYGRVVGSYSAKINSSYNTTQLSSLLKSVDQKQLDSVSAIKYFNDEAFVLQDADRRLNKSYGGCYSCLRIQDSLSYQLDSLKNFILATHAQD